MSDSENRSGRRTLIIGGIALVVAVILVIIYQTTGWLSGSDTVDSGTDDRPSANAEYSGDDAESDDRSAAGEMDIPAYERKGVPLPSFDGLDDKDANAVILSVLGTIYNTDPAATDSPTANSLQAKGLMTPTLADKLSEADKARGPSARWLRWGEKGVELRSTFILSAEDFDPDSTFCPKWDSDTEGKCEFVPASEDTQSTDTSVQRIVKVQQKDTTGQVETPESIIVRITAHRDNRGEGWKVSTIDSEEA